PHGRIPDGQRQTDGAAHVPPAVETHPYSWYVVSTRSLLFDPMRIGFVADIHEDIDSLRAGFTLLEQRNCDAVACLGDIVGFTLPFQRHIRTRNADACVHMVREGCATAIAGNHDLFAVRRTPAFTAGFPYREHWYDLAYEERARVSRNRIWLYEDSELPNRLSQQSIEYLHALPEFALLAVDAAPLFLSHFHYPDVSGSTIATPRKARHLHEHFRFIAEHRCTLSFSGHGHPEGCARGDRTGLRFFPFGSYPLGPGPLWFVAPCIANTTRANGVMILDTIAGGIDVVPLGSPKTIV
ncbi:MAG: metallophosphoesterase family protein, partial [Bacteroidota bacterium]